MEYFGSLGLNKILAFPLFSLYAAATRIRYVAHVFLLDDASI